MNALIEIKEIDKDLFNKQALNRNLESGIYLTTDFRDIEICYIVSNSRIKYLGEWSEIKHMFEINT